MHYSVLVLVDDEQNIEKAVEKLMAPYNERLEVEKETHECGCLWNPDTSDYTGDPDPDCRSCEGSGQEVFWINPKAKWDFYQIGGRWTGLYSDYDPTEDDRNREVCDLCCGTGRRLDIQSVYLALSLGRGVPMKDRPSFLRGEHMFGEDSEPWDYNRIEKYLEEVGCNGCEGRGWRKKWPTQWEKYDGDILPTTGAIQKFRTEDVRTYAVVTPDGEWHEKTEGFDIHEDWFSEPDEKRDEIRDRLEAKWEKDFENLLENHRDTTAVVVDIHI